MEAECRNVVVVVDGGCTLVSAEVEVLVVVDDDIVLVDDDDQMKVICRVCNRPRAVPPDSRYCCIEVETSSELRLGEVRHPVLIKAIEDSAQETTKRHIVGLLFG
eukprot:6476664-Amphidinium_carterae.1